MIEDSGRTLSERLFEQFCEENRIVASRIEEGELRTPDYEIRFGEHRVVVEVKQFDPNKEDRAHAEMAKRGWPVAFFEDSAKRVRLKIQDAREQLKRLTGGQCPAMLVLFDNVSPGTIDPTDIKTGMYGDETVTVAAHRPGDRQPQIIDQGFGSKRKLTQEHNTTFSAVALLYESMDRSLRLSVFHNYYAARPIRPTWLRRERVRHFGLNPEQRGVLPEWEEI